MLVVDMWFVIAHLLGFEFVPSPSGRAVEAGVECGCTQAVFCQPLLSSRSSACFIHRLYTERLRSERNVSALQSLFLLVFIANENADGKLWF